MWVQWAAGRGAGEGGGTPTHLLGGGVGGFCGTRHSFLGWRRDVGAVEAEPGVVHTAGSVVVAAHYGGKLSAEGCCEGGGGGQHEGAHV